MEESQEPVLLAGDQLVEGQPDQQGGEELEEHRQGGGVGGLVGLVWLEELVVLKKAIMVVLTSCGPQLVGSRDGLRCTAGRYG